MREKRFLERLRAIERDPLWRGSATIQEAVASIQHHLLKILNTRQGSAPIATDFGVPDFSTIVSSFTPDSIPEIEAALSAVIRKYEPRLADIHVSFDPQEDKPFTMVFKLTAQVAVEGRQAPIVFETILAPDGHISILE